MLIIKDISNLQSYLSAYQNRKYSIGYVPTMGALHKGHGELINQSKKDNHKTIVSIFVNEKQFSSKEDFDTYPRNKGFDYDFCTDNEVDILFEPSSEEIFKNDETLLNNNYFKDILCDKYRVGHFDGVITVLDKFFSIIKSNKVYFGEKDYQQLKIIEKFIEEKYKSLDLVSVPTQRQEEGIAYSSRNEKLSKKQTKDFVDFHKKIKNFIISLEESLDIETANQRANSFIKLQDINKFDYFEFRNDTDLSFDGTVSQARLFYAIYKGKVRLIDNLKV
ncbi:pantoate--beta-alanine ligase [Alphaproteobacteria bacterium]|nr:pantoate--beta-alanine ligase [Alphaproteobacteria bacterium]